MKKTLLVIFCILTFAAVLFADNRPLANDNKSGIYSKSIEQVLRLSPEDIDLATAALIISEQWSDVVGGRNYLTKLDDMAYEIRNRMDADRIAANYKAVPIINKYLFEELGFKSVNEANNPDDLFLHSVLDKKHW
ncbi:MAG: hypothetical protein NTW55_00485 [Planctomycetota bacterium]|nr:hypothetical protein [Planctomycetota bacterium]